MSTVTPARDELLALALAMRGADWAWELEKALNAAAVNGWTWPRVFAHATRLMANEEASPREMAEEAHNPLERPSQPAPPTAEYAAARAALGMQRQKVPA